MKIQITQAEAAALVASKYQVAQSCVEVIMEPAPTLYGMNYVEAILRIVRIQFACVYLADQKIAAIKELRTLVTGLGLAAAKVAIEKPYEAIDYYLRNNKPMPNSYS